MPGFNVPTFDPERTGHPVVDRVLNKLRSTLQPIFQSGTTRIHGFDVPNPTKADDGKKLTWNASTQTWTLT